MINECGPNDRISHLSMRECDYVAHIMMPTLRNKINVQGKCGVKYKVNDVVIQKMESL